MRIAVRCPDDHPSSPGAVFAYRLGRIQDGVHNVLAHMDSPVPLEEFLQQMVEKAKAEFPGHEVRVERLVQKAENPAESEWVAADEVPADAQAAPAGEQHAVEVHAIGSTDAA